MNRIFISTIVGLICVLIACASTENTATGYEPDDIAGDDAVFSRVLSPEVPSEFTFAGDRFTFDRADMFERFDRELTSLAYTHGTTLLMMKRANKYFPVMAPILKKRGVPVDFLYLECVESSLNQRAVSPAKAAGFWQFMPSTAKEYGLEVNDYVDERFNIEKATDAAARYLMKGYRKYGNWESVAASYNGGMAKISRELDSQGQNSAFDLYLTEETSRYMFRIFAMKQIFENPADYGYAVSPSALYYPVETREIEVSVPIDDLQAWALAKGSNYQWLKELNPWLRSKSLPNRTGKTYKILLPADGKSLSRSGTTAKKVFNINDYRK